MQQEHEPELMRRFNTKVIEPNLEVRSGVYTVVDPTLTMSLDEQGEYRHQGLNADYRGPVETLLRVSAFGEPPFDEHAFALSAYPPGDGVHEHPTIGRYRGLYAGYAAEGDFREVGSSGGITTWLLTELLSLGRIDGVIQLVPNSTGDALFSYRVSRTAAEIKAGAKSRYYPGQLGDVLNEIRSTKGRFALTAIPSFAYEVRLLQHEMPEFRELVPYVIGLVCGHQKTANYALNLAWQAGIPPRSLDYIDFRRKVENQPSNRYTSEFFATVSGEKISKVVQQEHLFGTDWGLGMFKSNFSDFTEDAFNETADAVFGDAWLPKYTPDGRGTNIVITRNEELHNLLASAAEAGRLHLEPLTEADILRSQSSLVRQNIEEVSARYDYIARNGGYVPPRRRKDNRRVSFARKQIQIQRYKITQATHGAWKAAVEANDIEVFNSTMKPMVERYRWAQRLANANHLPGRAIRKIRRLLRA